MATCAGVLLLARPAVAAVCGDMVVEVPETCDDGNVVDGDGCSSACLIENQLPVCEGATGSVDELWPPNHKLVSIGVDGVTDPDGDPPAVTVIAVSQDEPVDDVGDGASCPDAAGVGTASAEVRAERSGRGDGRVYHVAFRADDASGGSCMGAFVVCVRHDRRKGGTCGDGGPLYDSTVGACTSACDLDACMPGSDEVESACDGSVPRGVARRLERAGVLLGRAGDAPSPARTKRLARKAAGLLRRAAARAGQDCGDDLRVRLAAAAACAECPLGDDPQ